MFDGLIPALRSTIPARLELDPLDPINRGLVGFWPLTEPGGAVFRDLSPYNRRASGVNTPTRVITQISRATSFNGSNQYVSTGITNFSPTAGSVVWFHRTAVAYNSGTFRGIWGQVPGWEFSAQVYLDNNWYIGWRNPAGDKRLITAATAANWPTNAVTAYVFTYDASGTKLYVNGALVASNATAQSPSDMGTSFLFGSQGAATYFAGDMFGARLIARALVPSEVRRISLDPWAGAFDPADRLFHAIKAPSTSRIATIAGTVDVTASIEADLALAATLAGTVAVTASLETDLGLAATVGGTVDVTGALAATTTLAAEIDGTVPITASILAQLDRLADITGTVSIMASLTATNGEGGGGDTHDGFKRRSRRERRLDALRARRDEERLADAQALRMALEAALGLGAEIAAPAVAKAMQDAPKPAEVDWKAIADRAEDYARLWRDVSRLTALVTAEAKRRADDDDDEEAMFLMGMA